LGNSFEGSHTSKQNKGSAVLQKRKQKTAQKSLIVIYIFLWQPGKASNGSQIDGSQPLSNKRESLEQHAFSRGKVVVVSHNTVSGSTTDIDTIITRPRLRLWILASKQYFHEPV